ncbi:polyprenyl synthetase family protein [Luteimonas sp. MC1782]|uniref:polyprenyl synthetase family protein n=1 Tax=Luteimonas sp. MC1782 TaxID=2760305 RepID=UPI0015FFF85C|nr:polyprenyl synthetase family protein [Luteimonas sp. MC1782]MBB1472660.1 polyprenyl synthetase family protein [Luteimonas sp. MC1782]
MDSSTSQAPAANARPALSLPAIQASVAADMADVDALIRRRLASDVVLVNQVAEHIVAAGGKRLRPMLLLLAARALGHAGADAHQLAAVVEFIHTSTLLHDDVVDESDLRRGRSTANAVWGNAASVLVGDFLYSRSFQLMVELGSMPVQEILADTTNRIAEGEVLQLLHVRNPDVDEAAYLHVIERKTAILFAAATRLGALLAGSGDGVQQRLHDYGLNLGLAFQIADDVLDYSADEATLGKHLGDDLAEGKMTLPLIHAMAHADDALRARLRTIVEHGDVAALDDVVAAIHASGGLAYSIDRAREYAARAEAALAGLDDNEAVAALRGLARYAVDRST